MTGTSPMDFFDHLDEAITRAGFANRVPLIARPVIWSDRPDVTIAGRHWRARTTQRLPAGRARYGFTLRQARQMRHALRPILASREVAIEAMLRSWRHQP